MGNITKAELDLAVQQSVAKSRKDLGLPLTPEQKTLASASAKEVTPNIEALREAQEQRRVEAAQRQAYEAEKKAFIESQRKETIKEYTKSLTVLEYERLLAAKRTEEPVAVNVVTPSRDLRKIFIEEPLGKIRFMQGSKAESLGLSTKELALKDYSERIAQRESAEAKALMITATAERTQRLQAQRRELQRQVNAGEITPFEARETLRASVREEQEGLKLQASFFGVLATKKYEKQLSDYTALLLSGAKSRAEPTPKTPDVSTPFVALSRPSGLGVGTPTSEVYTLRYKRPRYEDLKSVVRGGLKIPKHLVAGASKEYAILGTALFRDLGVTEQGLYKGFTGAPLAPTIYSEGSKKPVGISPFDPDVVAFNVAAGIMVGIEAFPILAYPTAAYGGYESVKAFKSAFKEPLREKRLEAFGEAAFIGGSSLALVSQLGVSQFVFKRTIVSPLERVIAKGKTVKSIREAFGKGSIEEAAFLRGWDVAFKELKLRDIVPAKYETRTTRLESGELIDIYTPVFRPYDVSRLKALKGEPELAESVRSAMGPYKEDLNIIGTTALERGIGRPLSRELGDIDAKLFNVVLARSLQSAEIRAVRRAGLGRDLEVLSPLFEEGGNLQFGQLPSKPKFGLKFRDEELINIGTTPKRTVYELEQVSDLFDWPAPFKRFSQTGFGKTLRLRDQLRRKVFAYRGKDVGDVADALKALEDTPPVKDLSTFSSVRVTAEDFSVHVRSPRLKTKSLLERYARIKTPSEQGFILIKRPKVDYSLMDAFKDFSKGLGSIVRGVPYAEAYSASMPRLPSFKGLPYASVYPKVKRGSYPALPGAYPKISGYPYPGLPLMPSVYPGSQKYPKTPLISGYPAGYPEIKVPEISLTLYPGYPKTPYPPLAPLDYPPIPPTAYPPIPLPPTKPPKPMPHMKLTSIDRMKQRQAYNTYIRTRGIGKGRTRKPGRLIKANTKPLTKESAMDLGAYITDNTIAQTFTIKPVKGKPQKAQDVNFYWNLARNKYRQPIRKRATKERNLFIERRGYAIDTPGEIQQLKAAQLINRRRKALKTFTTEMLL